MSDLKTKYPVEYAVYNLSSVTVAVVFPLMKKQLKVTEQTRNDIALLTIILLYLELVILSFVYTEILFVVI